MSSGIFQNAQNFVIESATMIENMKINTQINNNIVNQAPSVPLSPIRNTPPSTTRNFTGQEVYLRKLRCYFGKGTSQDRKMYLLYGMGGIGKTQICLKLMDEISENYSSIFWIDATSQETIEQSLRDIYKIHVDTITPPSTSYAASTVLHWISMLQTKWLMIYDNADGSPDDVEKFLPPGNRGDILITSRNHEHQKVVSPCNSSEISEMANDEAINLLLKASGLDGTSEEYHEVASTIVEKLYRHPLAIDQAGAYINARKCGIDNYLSIYEKYRSNLMSKETFRGASKYERTVYGTLETSFVNILHMAHGRADTETEEAAGYAIKLINICAFMHRENISDEIFRRAAKYYTHQVSKHSENVMMPLYLPTMDTTFLNITGDNEWNELIYQESIRILLSHALITRNTQGNKFNVHPLVQAWCKDRMSQAEKQSFVSNCQAVLASSISSENTVAEYSYQMSVFVHVLVHTRENMDRMPYYHDIVDVFADMMKKFGKYEIEHMLRLRTLEVSKQIYGHHDPMLHVSMNSVATVLSELGKFTEAESIFKRILEMRIEILGKEDPLTINSMNNLAATLQSLGKFSESAVLTEEAVNAYTRVLGKDHPDTLTAMANLSSVYDDLEKYSDAEVMAKYVLNARTKIFGLDHPITLTSMNNLASVYMNLGKFPEAEKLQKEVMEKNINMFGKEHPNTLISMNNLAITYKNLKRVNDAVNFEIEVLEARRRTLGTEHPDTLSSMANLAASYQSLNKMTEAEALELEALELRTKILGSSHPDTLASMNNLAITFSNLGKSSESTALKVQIMETYIRKLGDQHPRTLEKMAHVSSAYSDQQMWSDAEKLEDHILKTRIKVLGNDHPDTLVSMNDLAYTYLRLGKLIEAETLQLQTVEKYTTRFGNKHPNLLTPMKNLADIYRSLNKLDEARKLESQIRKIQLKDIVSAIGSKIFGIHK